MLKNLFAVLLSSLLVACGGGGGGGASSNVVASTLAFPLRQININHLVTSSSVPFTVSGTYNGSSVTGSGNIADSTLSSAMFEGKSVLQQITTITGYITANGQTTSLASSSTTYVDSTYVLLGGTGNYYRVYAANSIPTSVHVSDTGIIATANTYTSSTNKTLIGTRTVSYAVEADTSTTALLSVIATDKDINGAVTETQVNQYRITADGSSSPVKTTISVNAGNLVLSF